MKEAIRRLEEFHEKFGLPVGTEPGLCDKDQQHLHYKLMLEELDEFKEACRIGDIVEIADGLGDVLFVLLSSAVAHGLQDALEDVFNEICDSNMSKLGADGKPIRREDGKILRGDGYYRPNIPPILLRYRIKRKDRYKTCRSSCKDGKILSDPILDCTECRNANEERDHSL